MKAIDEVAPAVSTRITEKTKPSVVHGGTGDTAAIVPVEGDEEEDKDGDKEKKYEQRVSRGQG